MNDRCVTDLFLFWFLQDKLLIVLNRHILNDPNKKKWKNTERINWIE